MIDKELLINLAKKSNIEITNEQAEKFDLYAEMLVETNKSINLTAITEPREIVTKHFLDSILPLTELDIKQNARVIDVGTGAGFPGIPMKILRPDLDLILLDSLQKRVKVLEGFCEKLGLEKVTFIHGRAEEVSRTALRESCDVAVSRAVARLNKLCEYCMPFVKCGGIFAALKGPTAKEETAEASRAVSILGGELLPIISVNIPDTDLSHTLVRVKKTSNTTDKYPRQSNKISAKPL